MVTVARCTTILHSKQHENADLSQNVSDLRPPQRAVSQDDILQESKFKKYRFHFAKNRN